MAIDVTVIGASGATVTIPFTSVDSAFAAQTALAGISNLVLAGVLEQVNYTGGGTLPAIAAPATQGGVLALGAATTSAIFGLSGNYVSAVLGGAVTQPLIVGFGANSDIVAVSAGGSTISGGGATIAGGASQGAQIGNLGANTQVFFGGAGVETFAELGLGAIGGAFSPSATVWVTTALKGSASFDNSSGSTTINLDSVASSLSTGVHPFGQTLILTNSGDGQATVNIHSTQAGISTDGNVISFRETSTVAATVNAAGGANGVATGGNESWMLMKTGNAFINGGDSEIILLPTNPNAAGILTTSGSATLFGGTGTDLDSGVGGLIKGGSGGNNVLFGALANGTSTLIGGGNNDVMAAQSSGNLLESGKGTGEQLYGNGSGSGNTFGEGVSGSGNTALVGLFISGVDTISLVNPAGGFYTTVTGSPTATQVSFAASGANTTVNFGDGTTWTVLNAHLTSCDFH